METYFEFEYGEITIQLVIASGTLNGVLSIGMKCSGSLINKSSNYRILVCIRYDSFGNYILDNLFFDYKPLLNFISYNNFRFYIYFP